MSPGRVKLKPDLQFKVEAAETILWASFLSFSWAKNPRNSAVAQTSRFLSLVLKGDKKSCSFSLIGWWNRPVDETSALYLWILFTQPFALVCLFPQPLFIYCLSIRLFLCLFNGSLPSLSPLCCQFKTNKTHKQKHARAHTHTIPLVSSALLPLEALTTVIAWYGGRGRVSAGGGLWVQQQHRKWFEWFESTGSGFTSHRSVPR